MPWVSQIACSFIINFVPFIQSATSSSSRTSTHVDSFNLASSSLVRQLPIFLRASLCSSIALNIFCVISSLIGATIVAWEDSPTWNSSSWIVSTILTKRLLFFSPIQIGVGMCFLDFGGAMVLEKKSHFYYVHVSIKDSFCFLVSLKNLYVHFTEGPIINSLHFF